jgi:hypothetical protein
MGNAQESICFTCAWARDLDSKKKTGKDLFAIPFLDSNKQETTLRKYLGDNKCMLIVNVASG